MSLPASCGPALPSEVPLGGTESATEEQSSPGSSRAPHGERADASSEFEGEGGSDDAADADEAKDAKDAKDGKDAKQGEADETIEVAATAGAAAPGDKGNKKTGDAPAVTPGAPPAPCDDTSGSEPSCRELESGACKEVFGPLCEQLGDALKPKIATTVVQCLVENNRRSRCESIEECLKRGLEQACVSPPDRDVCEKLFERCDPPEDGPWQDVDQCARGLASLKPSVRTKVVECLEDSCELETCFLKAGT